VKRALLGIHPTLLLVVVELLRCSCWVEKGHHECNAVGCKARVHACFTRQQQAHVIGSTTQALLHMGLNCR
jgi:hypothetical protein